MNRLGLLQPLQPLQCAPPSSRYIGATHTNPTRAGVILRAKTLSGINLYLLGADEPTEERGDWGGWIEKFDKDPFHAASRELWEETLECISIDPERIKSGIIFQENGTLISFVTVEIEELLDYVQKLDEAFSAAKQARIKTEMRGAKLLMDDELLSCINNKTMYSVVANVLKKNLSILAQS